jgi:cytochrome c oxidase assembly factor CtaG
MTSLPPGALANPAAALAGPAIVLELAPLALVGLAYGLRVRALAADDERAVARRRQACFYGGLLVVAAALVALDADSRRLVWVQTILSILIGDAAALALVLGLTAPLLTPLARIRALGGLRVLAHPALALALYAGDLYAWQLPRLCQGALQYQGVDALRYACLLACALNMWACLLGPRARPRWFDARAKLAFILIARLAGAALGNLWLWSDRILYPGYLSGQAHFHIAPLADQSIAGTIMLGWQSLALLGGLWWLFLSTARAQRECRRLLEYARARGLALSRERAERAAQTGCAAELRERLEALLEQPGRADARQPPATAGRIVSSAPSATGVARPSRKRMSSPAT